MSDQDPQAIWASYYNEKKSQRLREAADLWRALDLTDKFEAVEVTIEFVHFCSEQSGIRSLVQQLAENYEVEVARTADGYWLAQCSSGSVGFSLNQDQHIAWVDFMCDVAQSHGCVFSTWTLHLPVLQRCLRSESF